MSTTFLLPSPSSSLEQSQELTKGVRNQLITVGH